MGALIQLIHGASLIVTPHPPVPKGRKSVYVARVEIYRQTWNDFVGLVRRSYSDAQALLERMRALSDEESKRIKNAREEAAQARKAIRFYEQCERRYGKDSPINTTVTLDDFDGWRLEPAERSRGNAAIAEFFADVTYRLVMPALEIPRWRFAPSRYGDVRAGDTFSSKKVDAEIELKLLQAVQGDEQLRLDMLAFRVEVLKHVLALYEVFGVLEAWDEVMRPYERFLASDRDTGPDPLGEGEVSFSDGRAMHKPFAEVLLARFIWEHRYRNNRKMVAAQRVCEWHNQHHGPLIYHALGKEADLEPKGLLRILSSQM